MSFTARTLRLLLNVAEFEREVIETSHFHGCQMSVSQKEANDVENDFSCEELQRTLDLARRIQSNVPRNNVTEEFHRSCEEEDWTKWFYGWKHYKKRCRNKHAWGQYFRSELDWDWNLSGILKRMYKLPRKHPEPSPGPQHDNLQIPVSYACPEPVPTGSTRPIAKLSNGLLEAVVTGSVNEVRIVEVSPTGETTHKTFFAASPSTSKVSQESNTCLAMKGHSWSDSCPSTSSINIPALTALHTQTHGRDDYIG